MPCDTITTQTVTLTKANADLIAKAFEALGIALHTREALHVAGYNRDGQLVDWRAGSGLTIRGTATTAEAITQAYSKAAVSWAAARAGFTVKTGAAPNTLTLERR
jgi:hypothetical protein